jgi:hypothetical protein
MGWQGDLQPDHCGCCWRSLRLWLRRDAEYHYEDFVYAKVALAIDGGRWASLCESCFWRIGNGLGEYGIRYSFDYVAGEYRATRKSDSYGKINL